MTQPRRRSPVREHRRAPRGLKGALQAPEVLEPRRVMASASLDHDFDVYAMLLINKMRANPAQFGLELKNLYRRTDYISSHGMSGDDPIWADLRAQISDAEGSVTAAGMRWHSGFDGRSGTTFLSVISSLPQTGPLVLTMADEAAADGHSQWMMANGYAHTGDHPKEPVDGLGYNPGATPNTWDATDKDHDGPFAGRAENISYWYTVGLYPKTEAAWRRGELTWEGYFQRVIYADTLGFMLEMNNLSETSPWGHLLNLASYSPDHPGAVQAGSGGNKKLGVMNGLGISFMGGSTSTCVTTHRLSYAPSLRHVAIVTYQDNNENQFYDVGEGLGLVTGAAYPFATKPNLPSTLGYDWGGFNTGDTYKGSGLFVRHASEDYGIELSRMTTKVDGKSYALKDYKIFFNKRNQVVEVRYPKSSYGLSPSPLVPEVVDSEEVASQPVVLQSVSMPSPGTYALGDKLEVTANFSKNVEVRGVPRVQLVVGGDARSLSYVSGSGTPSLRFSYTVTRRDISDSVQLGSRFVYPAGGGIVAGRERVPVLLPIGVAGSVAESVRVDGVPPRVLGHVGLVGYGPFVGGMSMEFVATFSERVAVAGTPYIELRGLPMTRHAVYVSGSGSDTLTFRYVVNPSDALARNRTLSGGLAIMLPSGATVRDNAGNAATLGIKVVSMKGIRVGLPSAGQR